MRNIFRRAVVIAVTAVLAAGGFAAAGGELATTGEPDARFILRTADIDGTMGFIGAGGEIDRVINPTLAVEEGDLVELVLLNGNGMSHYFIIEELGVGAAAISEVGDRTIVRFVAEESGTFTYSCALADHWRSGMIGRLVVAEATQANL